MNSSSKYLIRASEQPGYSPANHTGTRNVRLVSPELNGSKYMEIVLGDIERSQGSPAHAHPELEQAAYVLEGEALAEIDGVEHHVHTGDLLYFPAMTYHSIKVLSERIKLLVIYAPPFGDDPQKRIEKK